MGNNMSPNNNKKELDFGWVQGMDGESDKFNIQNLADKWQVGIYNGEQLLSDKEINTLGKALKIKPESLKKSVDGDGVAHYVNSNLAQYLQTGNVEITDTEEDIWDTSDTKDYQSVDDIIADDPQGILDGNFEGDNLGVPAKDGGTGEEKEPTDKQMDNFLEKTVPEGTDEGEHTEEPSDVDEMMYFSYQPRLEQLVSDPDFTDQDIVNELYNDGLPIQDAKNYLEKYKSDKNQISQEEPKSQSPGAEKSYQKGKRGGEYTTTDKGKKRYKKKSNFTEREIMDALTAIAMEKTADMDWLQGLDDEGELKKIVESNVAESLRIIADYCKENNISDKQAKPYTSLLKGSLVDDKGYYHPDQFRTENVLQAFFDKFGDFKTISAMIRKESADSYTMENPFDYFGDVPESDEGASESDVDKAISNIEESPK